MADLDYKKLVAAMLEQFGGISTKAVSSTPTAVYGHGPGGLFSTPGLSRPLFSAMLLPRLGLQARLPVLPTQETNPLHAIITGVTATSGSEPTGVCDDPPVAGTSKLCIHSFVFGRFSRMSKVFDLDRIGQITNRGEFMDLTLQNNPFGPTNPNPNIPGMPGADMNAVARNEIAKSMFEMAAAWGRDFARVLYTGNPTNNTAGGGYKEFYGLEYLVNTGYRDAETGNACPAVDSIIRSFGNLIVSTNASAFIKNITNMYRNLKYIGVKSGLDPVQWIIVMPFGLFYEITEVWPVTYLTYRALAIPTGSTNFVNSADAERMRDEMRGDLYNYTGQFLLIDGQKVPVVLDDAVPETENGDGTFTSEMFFVPMTVMGGTPVTYMEHYNYDAPNGTIDAAKVFAPGDSYYTTDSGRFLWHKKPPTNFCVQLLAKTEPRLMFLTPYLAGRLTNIKYMPVEHERSPFTDSEYFVNGGVSGGYAAPSLYSPTSR